MHKYFAKQRDLCATDKDGCKSFTEYVNVLLVIAFENEDKTAQYSTEWV